MNEEAEVRFSKVVFLTSELWLFEIIEYRVHRQTQRSHKLEIVAQ